MKNLVAKTTDRLLSEFKKRDLAALTLVAEIRDRER